MKDQNRSPVTARAVCLGLLFSTVINLVMPYNDHYLNNTLLIGNHFPVIAIVILMALVFGFNVGLKRWFGVTGLSRAELMLIWSMIGISGGIASAGIMRYFPSYAASPAYYTDSGNEWDVYVLRYIPDWMVLSRDPASRAVKWFMEGLPRGQAIPWARWIVPTFCWSAFMLLMYAANFALVSLFYHQWSVRERLIYPVVQVPLLISEEASPGSWVNAFFRSRLTWAGFAIPCAIWGINGLRTYFPELPNIPMNNYIWDLFPDRPWNEFHIENTNVYFTVIGLTFLLSAEISFSFWFFFILYKLSFVFVAWLGAPETGFFGNWVDRTAVFESAGCILAIAAFLFYTARVHLREWWGRAMKGGVDRLQDPIAPRLALALMVTGLAGMVGWFMLAGVQWWAALIAVVIFLAVILVETRIIAEAGLVFVDANVRPYDIVTGLVPAGWVSGLSLNALALHNGVMGADTREVLMPYAMNGTRAASQTGMRLGRVLGVFALAAFLALGTGALSRIATGYKYGAVNMDAWGSINAPRWFIGSVVTYQKTPPPFDFVRVGERKIVPVNLAHVVVGGGVAVFMLAMRSRFLWWPLHPFGMVMWGNYAMNQLWFSLFVGWVAKVSIMTFGGALVYRRCLPFALGLVLGESVIGAFWILAGLATGVPGIYVMPN